MKIGLLIQDENFYLYKYLHQLLESQNIVMASILSQKLPSESWSKTLNRYYTLFGPFTFCQLFLKTAYRKLLKKGDLKVLLEEYKVPLVPTENVNNPHYIEKISNLGLDLLVSIASPQILKPELLSIPKQGAINLHGGYLPDFPGVFTPFWNLLEGSKEAGCTIHYMEAGVDSGPIIKQCQFPIEPHDSMFSLYEKIVSHGIPLLLQSLDLIKKGEASMIENTTTFKNYHSFPTKQEAQSFRNQGFRYL